jgi:NTE family protein
MTDQIEGNNHYLHSYAYFQYNSLNRKEFTTNGWDIRARAGIIYNQQPRLQISTDTLTNMGITTSFGNYQQVHLKVENFKPLSSRATWITQFNTGINFGAENVYFNFFNVGGIVDFLRNQIPFTGINEYEINTSSIAVVGVGYQYQLLKSLYITARANAATYDFLEKDVLDNERITRYLTGYGVSVGYNSGIGPISLSMMYSDQAQHLSGYVNIGFHF